MDRKKELGITGGLIALGAIIVVVTVVWAAYTANLTISGSATVAKQSWSVIFQNLGSVTEANDNGVNEGVSETTTPTITGANSIGNFAVTLSKPGDSASYIFEIANTGTFGAKINSGWQGVSEPICTAGANSTNNSDASNVCGNLTYSLNYVTVDNQTGDVTVGSAVRANDTWAAGDVKKVQLKIYYSKDVAETDLPTDAVSVSNLGFTIPFSQT